MKDMDKGIHSIALFNANEEISFRTHENDLKASELIDASTEIAFQIQEKEPPAIELAIANNELGFRNNEKEKRATKLSSIKNDLTKAEAAIRKLNEELEQKVVKRSAQYAFISKVNQTIVHMSDVETLFRESCDIAIKFGNYKMAWIGGFDVSQKQISLLASSGIPEQDINLSTNIPYDTNEPQEYVLRTGTYYLCNDLEHTLTIDGWNPYAKEHHTGSCIVLPIKKAGSIFGTFNLYASEMDYFCEEDIALLEEVSSDISFALELFEKAERHQEAEKQMQLNFAALEAASNEQSAILNTLPARIALLDNEGTIVKVNEEWLHFGQTNGIQDACPQLGKNYIEISENASGREAEEGQQMAQGLRQILSGERDYFTMEYVCDDLTEKRWFKAEVRPFKGNPLSGAVVMHHNITERKKTEHQLILTSSEFQHAVNDLNKIMDSSMDVICAIDADGLFLKVSAASETVWGYTPEELIGTPIFNHVYHEDLQKTKASVKNVMEGNNLNQFENRYVRKDGTLVTTEWNARWNAKDQIRYGVARDISEKKRWEKAIEKERQRFYDLFTDAPSSMGVLHGPNHIFEIVNPLLLKLIGKKDIIGKTVKEVLPEVFDQGLVKLLDNVYKTGKTFSSSEVLIKLDTHGIGQLDEKYLNLMFRAHRTKTDIIDGILFFAIDVTEQVVLRKKIEESEVKLKKAQALLNISNWEIDLSTYINTWSEECYDILGYRSEDVKPSLHAFFSKIHRDDFKMAKAKVEATFHTFEAGSFSARLKPKNGALKYVYAEWKFEFDKNAKPIHLYGILQDITESKIAEKERLKITHDLLQRNRDLEQFTFIISHNLRAPAANIMGFSEYFQEESITPQEQKELLKGLATSVSGLDTIIKDINSILQIKREINDKKETIIFSQLVKDIINSIGTTINLHHVTITTDFEDVDDIFSVKVYMHSIFYNLISNSIKYCRPGEQPLIEIKSKKDNGKIVLAFKDNGLGIDMQNKGEKVFGLYQRFHNHVEGKGMGLFMVKTQVEALSGKITVESELDKGTEFTIVF